jgi:tRNA(fMet)-specific endonuclease VapC
MLDTDICIYLINEKSPELARKITSVPTDEICISTITLAELEYGISKSQHPSKNAQALAKFLSILNVVDFNDKAAQLYGEVRADLEHKGTVIGNMDMLIAGHAKSKGYIVVTNNEHEFRRVDGLAVENWVI